MGDICRVCLANNIEGIDIYNNYKGEFNLREIIYELSLVEISPCNSLPQTVCQICADKLVDFHIFSVMLLESQNELLAAEEALNVNLPEVTKLGNSSVDDDNIEIDEIVLELFGRLHENDPSVSKDLSNSLDFPLQEVSVHLNRHSNASPSLPQTIFHETSITDVTRNNFKPKIRNTSKTFNNNYCYDNNNSIITSTYANNGNMPRQYCTSTVQNPINHINNDDGDNDECAIEIISQEIISQPNSFVTSDDSDNFLTNSANDIVRIQLSFVDKTEQTFSPATNGREVATIKEKETAKTTTKMSTITTTTTMTTTTTTTTRVYICDVCHKNFPVAGRFLAHFRRVHLKSFYKKQAKCPYCPRYFTTIVGHSNMNRHVRLVHKTLGNQITENASTTTSHPINCEKCDEKFDDSIELYEHSKTHDENVTETPDGYTLRCDYCQYDAVTLEQFTQHMIEIHLAHETSIKPFKCRWCNIRMRKIQGLYSHVRTKHNPFASRLTIPRTPKRKSRYDKCQCETCGKWMSSPAALVLHNKSHTTSRIFSCEICSANFKYQSSLLMHLNKHTIDTKKYKCHECGDSFRRSIELKSHMKAHGIGLDKLHKCSICTKPFRFKEHLTIHMWTHTREHPFECSLCTKAFTRKSKLEDHMKNLHK